MSTAIEVQKPPRPTFVAAGAKVNAASGTVYAANPAGIQQGDLLICVVNSLDNVAHTMRSSWTQAYTQVNTTTMRLSVFYKRCDGPYEADTHIIGHPVGSEITACIVAYRYTTLGLATPIPLPLVTGSTRTYSDFPFETGVTNRYGTESVNASGTAAPGAAVTSVSTHDTKVIQIVGSDGARTSASQTMNSVAMTERVDYQGTGNSICICDVDKTSDTTTGVGVNTLSGASASITFVMVLKNVSLTNWNVVVTFTVPVNVYATADPLSDGTDWSQIAHELIMRNPAGTYAGTVTASASNT